MAGGPIVENAAGQKVEATPTYQAGATYSLAANENMVSGTPSTPVTGILSASYILTVTATAWNGATLTLQELGPDGASWVASIDANGDPVAFTANGRAVAVTGANAAVRLMPSGGSPTGVYAVMS